MLWLNIAAFALLLAADQGVKLWAMRSLAPVEAVTLVPGLFGLRYAENSGAAFSILSGQRPLLLAVSAAAIVFLGVYGFITLRDRALARWAFTLMLAGAIGNFVDRLFRGYVVDMFEFLFVRFAIFNVADIMLTLGVTLFAVYMLFFSRGAVRAA